MYAPPNNTINSPLLQPQIQPQTNPIQPVYDPTSPVPTVPLGTPDVRFVSSLEISPDPNVVITVDHDDLYENTSFLTENKLNLGFTIAVVALLVCVIVFSPPVDVLHQWGSSGIGISIPFIICCAFMGIFWIAYLIETCCSGTRQYLSEISTPTGVHNHIQRVRSNYPILSFHVECYHYETITTSSTDSNGQTTTSSRTEKRVTYRETQHFAYDCWDDISGELLGVGAIYRLTRIRYHKTHVFADENTCRAWEAEAQAIQNRNRHRDTHMSFWHSMEIQDYTPRMLAITGAMEDAPMCLGLGWYVVWSLVMFGYCYRSWFHCISTKQNYEYVKRIKRNRYY